MAEQVELKIEPSSDRFDPLDDRWLEQVDGFADELDQELGGVERERRPVDGGKGFDLASIVLRTSRFFPGNACGAMFS